MKCKECEYYNEKRACLDACGGYASDHTVCYNENERKGFDKDTCVWNCDFCADNRKIKETTHANNR